MRWLSRLVTGIVIVVALAGLVLVLRSAAPTTTVGQRFTTWAMLRDGSRLAIGSPVMIAGVRIGDITRLTIAGDFARVDMALRDDTDIPIDSWVIKRAESAFGDSYIEIIPSDSEQGAPIARKLRSGEQLIHVLEGGSTDTVLRSIARTMPKIDDGLDTIHDFALNGRKWASGPFQDALIGADRWLVAGHIDAPIASVDRAMQRFESGSTRAADAVASAKPEVTRTFDRIDRGIANARDQIASAKVTIRDGLANARDGIDRVDPTIQQLSDVMSAVDEGRGDDFEGKLGRIINNPDVADTIEDVTETIAGAASTFNKFKSWLGFRFEYSYFSQLPRAYVTAEIRARNDKFYLIEFERDPLGGLPADQLADAPNTATFTRTQVIQNTMRFTAEYGKTFGGMLQLRAGLKESTFGLGADLLLHDGMLRLSSDLFGSFDRTPRFKVTAALEVFRSVYVLAGVDDILNNPSDLNIVNGNTTVPTELEQVRVGRDYFLGATLHFTDADLATLLRVYGALILGLL